MLSIEELKHLGAAILENSQTNGQIFYCVSEDHVMDRLRDTPGTSLVMLYPQADRTGKQNEAVDQSATWLFVLEKGKFGQTNKEELAQYERLQKIIILARDFIENKFDQCEFVYLNRYQPSSTQIIPEFNEFGGFNGWSMSLVF